MGNDVWVGCKAMILSGVTLGDGAVVWGRGGRESRRTTLPDCGREFGPSHTDALFK
ncbi:MAG: hypothetical protein AABN95_16795 [Acidobacteriota bacterium]